MIHNQEEVHSDFGREKPATFGDALFLVALFATFVLVLVAFA